MTKRLSVVCSNYALDKDAITKTQLICRTIPNCCTYKRLQHPTIIKRNLTLITEIEPRAGPFYSHKRINRKREQEVAVVKQTKISTIKSEIMMKCVWGRTTLIPHGHGALSWFVFILFLYKESERGEVVWTVEFVRRRITMENGGYNYVPVFESAYGRISFCCKETEQREVEQTLST